jgi:transketolase
MNQLEKRILEISYKHKLSHLSSNLSSVNIIDEIYSIKKENEKFILSNGHAGLALYAVLEKYYGINAEELHTKHGVHPNRDLDNKIFYSTGSLGCGLPAAIGMALANRKRNVYCLISDGEIFEGSIYESFNIIVKEKINNLNVFLNLNGYSALAELDKDRIYRIAKTLLPNIEVRLTTSIYKKIPLIDGVQGHYKVLSLNDFEVLKNA